VKERLVSGTKTWSIGEGNSLLVVHGGPGLDHEYLVNWLRPLATLRTLVFYDQLGCGDDKTPPASLSASSVVEQLDRILDELAREGPIDVLAHSWGAYPLYECLLRPRRQEIQNIILVSPVGLTRERFDESGARLVARIPQGVLERIERADEPQISGTELMSLLAPFYQANPKSPVTLGFRSYNADTFNRITETLGNYDCRSVADWLPQRALRLYGDHDIEIPEGTQELAGRSTLLTVTSSGHFSFAEQAAEFIKCVSAFLTANDR
jgi:proline iminopeptidase